VYTLMTPLESMVTSQRCVAAAGTETRTAAAETRSTPTRATTLTAATSMAGKRGDDGRTVRPLANLSHKLFGHE